MAEKANEIVAIPKLLDMLAIEGTVVTTDARYAKGWGCQRAIAQKIKDKKADYILALKGNQGTLREDVELFANEQKVKNFSDTTVIHDIGWLQERHQWPSLKSVVSRVPSGGVAAQEHAAREARPPWRGEPSERRAAVIDDSPVGSVCESQRNRGTNR